MILTTKFFYFLISNLIYIAVSIWLFKRKEKNLDTDKITVLDAFSRDYKDANPLTIIIVAFSSFIWIYMLPIVSAFVIFSLLKSLLVSESTKQ